MEFLEYKTVFSYIKSFVYKVMNIFQMEFLLIVVLVIIGLLISICVFVKCGIFELIEHEIKKILPNLYVLVIISVIILSLIFPFAYQYSSGDEIIISANKTDFVIPIYGKKYNLINIDKNELEFVNPTDSIYFYLDSSSIFIRKFDFKTLQRIFLYPLELSIGKKESKSDNKLTYRILFIFLPKLMKEKIEYLPVLIIIFLFVILPHLITTEKLMKDSYNVDDMFGSDDD